jgi:hypothetical protein
VDDPTRWDDEQPKTTGAAGSREEASPTRATPDPVPATRWDSDGALPAPQPEPEATRWGDGPVIPPAPTPGSDDTRADDTRADGELTAPSATDPDATRADDGLTAPPETRATGETTRWDGPQLRVPGHVTEDGAP